MSFVRPISKLGSAVLLAASALVAQPALAHAHLEAQIPAAGSTINAVPKAIELKFSEGVEPKFSGIVLAGAKHAPVQLGAPTVDSKDDTRLIIPVGGLMPAGSYQVSWHAVSVDGHKTKGEYTFNVK
ncbi:CopC domain-containing protein YobA [Paralcaligenes ureilyticus]|uniref:CopC domain-containing protein n=1 Tax=Paralcaligenes ureilyticus TaxID=627131 RepID=A0A4V2UYD7_9BURK|nr:CopC domain-containing protein YobA [Paralcaligenes ureilyticus]TCT06998.1 hypothetical protein EDC26_10753 [Paralcaligenes ureilyticus]